MTKQQPSDDDKRPLSEQLGIKVWDFMDAYYLATHPTLPPPAELQVRPVFDKDGKITNWPTSETSTTPTPTTPEQDDTP